MVEEEPMDFGGTQIDIQDVISDDLISRIKGLNPDLGVEGKDPLYKRYAQYRDEIENAELIIIDANSLNRSSIMNLDLSGDISGIVLGWICCNRGIVKSLSVAVYPSSNRGAVVCDGSSSLLYTDFDTAWG